MQAANLNLPAKTAASKRALAGFLIAGVLLAFPGAILPAWGYHLRPHYVTVGNYFLAVTVGIVLGTALGRRLIAWASISRALSVSCIVSFASLALLSFTAPPVSEWWRVPGLAGIGVGGGALSTAIFHAISPAYRSNPVGTVNLAGVYLGVGTCIAPLLIAGTFHVYSVQAILFLLAMIPAAFAIVFARMEFRRQSTGEDRGAAEVIREFTVPSAVFFTLLLFFQFGNEWAISGWLPLFLAQRLGMNPATALILLALYWFSLLLGRLAVQILLLRVSHWRLLFASATGALFGCLILTSTNNLFGASMGTLLVGLGFAPIYPLAVERIGARFPHYHPGVFNGIFSIGLIGGMLAPATLGYAAHYLGIRVVMALPAIGTFVVLVLVIVIWLEAKFADWTSAKAGGGGFA